MVAAQIFYSYNGNHLYIICQDKEKEDLLLTYETSREEISEVIHLTEGKRKRANYLTDCSYCHEQLQN